MTQTLHTIGIRSAVNDHMDSLSRNVRTYALLAFAMVVLGGLFFVALLIFIPDNPSVVLKEAAKIPTYVVTFGATGWFLIRAFSIWEAMRRGRTWLEIYNRVCGPPPQEMAASVEESIYIWMRGK